MRDITKYLEDYKAGRISKGLGIGSDELDDFIRYKQGQFNIINGIDNVGKTVWMLWYFLNLSVKWNITWIVWSGENKAGQLFRQLIEMYTGKKLEDIPLEKVFYYQTIIANWFEIVDNSVMYTSKELFDRFKQSSAKGCLIDPYTGLNRGYTHADNYDFLNESRDFCNTTGKTLYLNTHPNTPGANMIYGDRHELAGYRMPPGKSQSEGGQPFANRCDDFITIHRLTDHPTLWKYTYIYVRKVKDTETGGRISTKDLPVGCDFNKGLGFTIGGINPLTQTPVATEPELNEIETNKDFLPF